MTVIARIGAGVVAAMLLGGQAFAADPVKKKEEPAAAPSVPFDLAFGARLQSNYMFRGISQTSNWGPSPQGYGEAQFLDNFFYVGVNYYRTDLPTTTPAEIDFTAGIRPKAGPITFDLGILEYYYPSERRLFDITVNPPLILTPRNSEFLEFHAAFTYAAVPDVLTLGAGVYHAGNYLGTGAHGDYFNGTFKWTLPSDFLGGGFAISGELGYYSLGRVSRTLGSFLLVDYTTWNIGASYTVKNVTFDARYVDTDLSKRECLTNTTYPKGYFQLVSSGGLVNQSRWCGATFMGTVSVDLTLSGLGVLPK